MTFDFIDSVSDRFGLSSRSMGDLCLQFSEFSVEVFCLLDELRRSLLLDDILLLSLKLFDSSVHIHLLFVVAGLELVPLGQEAAELI